ncbi:MAG: bifunctional DNA-binding transcriptional regulator/O6-methylguanine-DNA methyltransferase Ada [Anaerolineae bacterium]|nr:bifunctional DNA-binding transcriptional regulator/O6-methylguanine-DNA methyltransferase Ada [Anaerolineae bacterium]
MNDQAVQTPPTLNDELRWQATIQRDTRYDGAFVVAVKTTGIYCRPSCPAIKPKRQNVTFYMLSEAAEAAGFRACKRCRPQTCPPVDPQVAMVHQACRQIEQHEAIPSLSELAESIHVSPYHLQRTFKSMMGITPHQYANARRTGTLKALLKEGKPVTDALYEAGYGSSSRLYAQSDAQLGMSPSIYRKGGEGMDIRYTIQPCALGRALVAVTERGVCAVYLSDDDRVMTDALRAEFPAAQLAADSLEVCEWVGQVLEQLNGWAPHPDLPFDLQATAFQQRVWQALREIPLGETRTYQEIAVSLGTPNGARAVAKACADNRIAVLIPCHRVIRSDGSLAGYRWGIERKEKLLARERAQRSS